MVEVRVECETTGLGHMWIHFHRRLCARWFRSWGLQEAGYSLSVTQCFPGHPETVLLAENIASGRYRP